MNALIRPTTQLAKALLVPLVAATCAAHGTNGTTERISLMGNGSQAPPDSYEPSVSADGRIVTFMSFAELVPEDTNGAADVYALDRQTGSLTPVSVTVAGVWGNQRSCAADVSADGRFVAFVTDATNLAPFDFNDSEDVFVKDLATGALQRISEAPGSPAAAAGGLSLYPSISADGRYVAFSSFASSLVPDDTNGTIDVFVYDRQTDMMERVSVGPFGEPDGLSQLPSISADGRRVVFTSRATNLVATDTNGHEDIFIRDLDQGETRILSQPQGVEANQQSMFPEISADGTIVVFESWASNLVPGDTNDTRDVFRVVARTGAIELVSASGASADAVSGDASVSGDGRYVAFDSLASNLVPGDENDASDVFVYDAVTGVLVMASRPTGAQLLGNGNSGSTAISDDGSVLSFGSSATNLVPGDTNGGYDIFARTLYPDPEGHCQSSVTSGGCLPTIASLGLPVAAAPFGFLVTASSVPNSKAGLLVYGLGGAAEIPFLGGTLCVQPPTGRTPIVSSGGSLPPASDCTGSLALDMNAFAAGILGGAPHASLGAVGQRVDVQWWGRDPQSPFGTFLSDALSYTVGP